VWRPWALAIALLLPFVASNASATVTKSISEWVSCTGTSDDTEGTMRAFAAARQNAFTLVVDCPVSLQSGLAIDKEIFIEDGTSVTFTGAGKFYVNNMFHPAFVIANSHDITLTNWNVEWDGNVPINPDFGGYVLNGQFVTSPGITQPAGAFNDLWLTPWLATHRGINFDESQGWVKSIWVGGVNPAAVFFITGNSSKVSFLGLQLYAPATAGANDFIPMAFSLSANWKGNQTVTGKTPETTEYAAVPHGITFFGITLDGVLMGWQGNVQDATFENITSNRYSDLQDANGGNVGGIGKWFPPPHLFYLNTHAADPGLDNISLHFSNIVDNGVRLGVARDKGGNDSISGYANSLKLSCTECWVNGYTSHRPDGFMDVLNADHMVISKVVATFDSQFINNVYPAGLRFPETSYTNVIFRNVQMTDTPSASIAGPIGNATASTNASIQFKNFQITMNQWAGSGLPLPTITGTNNDVAVNFSMTGQNTKVSLLETGSMMLMLESSPAAVRVGASTLLTWDSANTTSCMAGGAWSGAVRGSGTQALPVAAGTQTFTLNCQNAVGAWNTSMNVVAQ
jgi:hypothetical protein